LHFEPGPLLRKALASVSRSSKKQCVTLNSTCRPSHGHEGSLVFDLYIGQARALVEEGQFCLIVYSLAILCSLCHQYTTDIIYAMEKDEPNADKRRNLHALVLEQDERSCLGTLAGLLEVRCYCAEHNTEANVDYWDSLLTRRSKSFHLKPPLRCRTRYQLLKHSITPGPTVSKKQWKGPASTHPSLTVLSVHHGYACVMFLFIRLLIFTHRWFSTLK
jgi:hypothetical protein